MSKMKTTKKQSFFKNQTRTPPEQQNLQPKNWYNKWHWHTKPQTQKTVPHQETSKNDWIFTTKKTKIRKLPKITEIWINRSLISSYDFQEPTSCFIPSYPISFLALPFSFTSSLSLYPLVGTVSMWQSVKKNRQNMKNPFKIAPFNIGSTIHTLYNVCMYRWGWGVG